MAMIRGMLTFLGESIWMGARKVSRRIRMMLKKAGLPLRRGHRG